MMNQAVDALTDDFLFCDQICRHALELFVILKC